MCIFGAQNATIEKKNFCLLVCLLLFIYFQNAMPPESYPKKSIFSSKNGHFRSKNAYYVKKCVSKNPIFLNKKIWLKTRISKKSVDFEKYKCLFLNNPFFRSNQPVHNVKIISVCLFVGLELWADYDHPFVRELNMSLVEFLEKII